MQRWHFTAGLAGAAALAALIVPSLRGGSSPEPARPIGPEGPGRTGAAEEPASGQDGVLSVQASLDQEKLLLGSGEDRYLVVEVTAPDMKGDVRRPVNLAVVMDSSGSMAGRGKIDNARMAAAELIGQLGPNDTFSLVTFGDQGEVVVPTQQVSDAARLQRLVKGIRPSGGTHLDEGLELGFSQLGGADLEGIKRVVILSDGMANIGVTDPGALAQLAGSRVEQGITVSALGLGLDYNEDLLTAMSDTGGGAYHFVDAQGQLAQIFQDELQQMTRVAARQAHVQVTLPPGVQLQEVYGWSATTTSDGYQVFLGDVHGGESRKIVARVRVDASAPGALDIAQVGLRYDDVDADRSVTEGTLLAAEVTADPGIAVASINRKAGASAARAHVGQLMDQSARDWDKGDLAGNQARLEEVRGLMQSLGTLYDDAELRNQEPEVAAQQAAFAAAPPASDAGTYEVKKAKEAARGWSR